MCPKPLLIAAGEEALMILLPLALGDPRLPDTFINLFPVPDLTPAGAEENPHD